MSAENVKTKAKGKDLVKDGQQIAIGLFELRQGSTVVGRLNVIPDGNLMVEHWDLNTSFVQPSFANTNQEIRFVYQGESMELQEFEEGIGASNTYIIARCQVVDR